MSDADSCWQSPVAQGLRHELANALVALSWCVELAEGSDLGVPLGQARDRASLVLTVLRCLEDPGPEQPLTVQLASAGTESISVQEVTVPLRVKELLELADTVDLSWGEAPATWSVTATFPSVSAIAPALHQALREKPLSVTWSDSQMFITYSGYA